MFKQMIDYQKKSLGFILKSMGIPELPEEEKKMIAEDDGKTYDPYGRDEMIENEIDDAIMEKNESDFDKYKGEMDWDRREE